MKLDGKKKKKQAVPVPEEVLQASQKAEETEEEEEEEEDDPEDEEYEEDSGYGSSGTSTEEDLDEYEDDAEEGPAKVMIKKLPNREAKKSKPSPVEHAKPAKRKSGEEKEVVEKKKKPNQNEKKHPTVDPIPGSSTGGKKGKKIDLVFDDTNVDLNLNNSDPANVTSRRVQLANNLIMMSKMIHQSSNNLPYDYAALAFQRRTGKDNKLFEFLLPLSLIPRIQQGLTYLIKENDKFFAGKQIC